MSITTALSRDKAGIKVSIKAIPLVEDFLRAWGSGEAQSITAHGRKWSCLDSNPLHVWQLERNPGLIRAEDGLPFSIHRPGQDLLYKEPNEREEVLNLAFLRLVGISEGPGVSFTVREVWTDQEIKRVSNRILLASKRLYLAYLRPITVSVHLSTQEVRG